MQYHHRNYEQLLKKKKNEIALNNIFYIERPTINFNKTINLILSNIKTINHNFQFRFENLDKTNMCSIDCFPVTKFIKWKQKKLIPKDENIEGLINYNLDLIQDIIKSQFIHSLKINNAQNVEQLYVYYGETLCYNFRNDDRLKDIELPFSLENGLPLIALNAIPFNQLRISCTMFTKIKSKEDLPLINFNYSLLNDDEI